MRIVSLTCSNTEIVCALGAADRLVGVDDHSDYPADVVAALPRVGPDLDIDVDAVAALSPDLVLASLTVPGHERVVERLERAGLPLMVPAPTSIDDVYRDIREIGARLDVDARAEGLVEAMRAGFADVAAAGEGGPRILIEWWPKPVIAPGRKSWAHDVLDLVGAVNPLGGEDVESRPLEMDEVTRLAPDAFVISWCGVDPAKYRPDVVRRNPAWAHLEAIRRDRVFCVPEAFLGRPGPRLVDGARALRAVVEACARTD